MASELVFTGFKVSPDPTVHSSMVELPSQPTYDFTFVLILEKEPTAGPPSTGVVMMNGSAGNNISFDVSVPQGPGLDAAFQDAQQKVLNRIREIGNPVVAGPHP